MRLQWPRTCRFVDRRLLCVAPSPAIDKLVVVDKLRPGESHRPEQVISVAGGKGLNVARAAARLGGSPTAVALLGGHAGAWIAAELERAGIESRIVWHGSDNRTCVSVYDRDQRSLTELYERAASVSAVVWRRFEEAIGEALRDGTSLVAASGSLPGDVPASAYASLCAAARAAGSKMLLDASGDALRQALPARPWLVKVNAEEASGVTGLPVSRTLEAYGAAERIRELGAENAIVTLGAEGAVLASEGGSWRIALRDTPGSLPVASGDTMLGAIGVRVAAGASLIEATRFGAAAAAANARVPGAACFDASTADRLAPDVSIERVAGGAQLLKLGVTQPVELR
jgi:tagatose 6-phosphate kinase